MQAQKLNLQLVDLLNEWDPFGIGAGNYDTEIADIVQAVHNLDDEINLATKIQAIFEFSFEKLLPQEECKEVAVKLLAIKDGGTCAI